MDCAFTTTPAFWVDDYEQRFVISRKLSKPTVFYDILDTVVRAMMWPKLVDYSNDDCMRLLRKLELETYASTVSTLRAHGELTAEKRKLLQALQDTLSISVERHQAEMRRVANDERLATIAHCLNGKDTAEQWNKEGARVVPLLPRLMPKTALYTYANAAATIQADKNSEMPPPRATAHKVRHLIAPDLPPARKMPPAKRRRVEMSVPTYTRKPPTSAHSRPVYAAPIPTSPLVTSTRPSILSRPTLTTVTRPVVPAKPLPPSPIVTAPPSSTQPHVVSTSSPAQNVPSVPTSSFVRFPQPVVRMPPTVRLPGQATLVAKPSFVRTVVRHGLSPVNATGQPVVGQPRVFITRPRAAQQLIMFPGPSGQKVVNVPFTQSLKNTHVATSSPLVYQQPSTSTGKGTITIQAFKQRSSTNPQNVILMPSSPYSVSKTVNISHAKNAGQTAIVTGTASTQDPSKSNQTVTAVDQGNIIEIQASGHMLQDILKGGQLRPDILELVQKAVNMRNNSK